MGCVNMQDSPSTTGRIRLVLAVHNHQPIGNFEGVCEAAYEDSYSPFLDVLEDFPGLSICLHNSGSLLEWLATAHPEYIERVRGLVELGQVEILGGPFYEPILSCIPRRDRIGQIVAYSKYLKELFGTHVRGMWVPERVWEQSFASDIARAGIEYTVLDDSHFKAAGVPDDQLHGYYLTEDEGRVLKTVPVSETLRYTIPFQEVQDTIDFLGRIHAENPNAICTFGDDGEKFGVWPETKKHVYEDGWLRRFFEALQFHSSWIDVTTMAEAIDAVPPVGQCYIPDGSYREMTEWALPTNRQIEYLRVRREKDSEADWHVLKPFLRGGFWRNFRVKYPEANEMYCRMLDVSSRIDELQTETLTATQTELLETARTELYRGQCNCSYWHGAFGGLYLPHLRNAVYKHLISADNLLEQVHGRSGRWVEIAAADYDHDGHKEVRLSGDRLVAWVSPHRGGQLYELDIRGTTHNLLATLDRRPEPYHDVIRAAASGDNNAGDIASIQTEVIFKQPGLEKKLQYDHWSHKSLVDHFLSDDATAEEFQRGNGGISDFATGHYDASLRRSDSRVEVVLTREGQVGEHTVRVTKTLAIDTADGSGLDIKYVLEGLPVGVAVPFGVEFNFAGMAAAQTDRYYYDTNGRQLGPLESVQSLDATDRLGLVDEWLGLDVAIDVSQPAGFWTFPIETISQSEGGYEGVHQSSVVVPHWNVVADDTGRWAVEIHLSTDTSAAQARTLTEPAAVMS